MLCYFIHWNITWNIFQQTNGRTGTRNYLKHAHGPLNKGGRSPNLVLVLKNAVERHLRISASECVREITDFVSPLTSNILTKF